MKRVMVILLLTTICSTSMADISTESIEDWYDELLELFDLYKDRDGILEEVDVYDYANSDVSQNFAPSTDIALEEPYSGDLPLSEPSETDVVIDPGQGVFENPDSPAISNPEPCSIILSSIGLGIVGYLKRRRAI